MPRALTAAIAAAALVLTGTGTARADVTLDRGAVATVAVDGRYPTIEGTGTAASLKATATCTATNSTQHWTYDKNGNRLTERNGISPGVTTTSTYDSSDRLTGQQIGTGTITVPSYDADGNMITDGNGRTWTYGLDGLTRSITTPTNTTTYGYDGDGRRLTSNVTAGTGAGSSTAYTWDANAPLATLAGISTDPDGAGPTAPTASSIRYDAGGAGTALNQTSAGTTNWYAHDPLGGITDLTSSAGVITRSQDWTPYGTTRTPIGAPATPSGPLPILGWTGALPDTATTWHLRARQYDPTLGSFITRDPAGMAGSAGYNGWYGTQYGYVNGRVLSAIDPTGMWTFSVCGALSATGLLGAAFQYCQLAIAYDERTGEVQIGATTSVTASAGWPIPAAAAQAEVAVSSGRRLDDLGGDSIGAGGAVGEGIVVSGSLARSRPGQSCDNFLYATLGTGVGLGSQVDGHVQYTHTFNWTYASFNPGDLFNRDRWRIGS